MLGQINKPEPLLTPDAGKIYNAALKEANKTKIIRWLTLTNSFQEIIRSTCNVKPMSHVSDIDFCFDMWTKFETLYQVTRFIECNAIFICLSSQTASDFSNVAQFADSLKRDYTHLKKIGVKDLLDWVFTTLLFHSLDF